ncbi:ArsR/SmtB family transcription factor [Flavobacterium aestivum]|uniref:ArsR/SmtB family transcription factor n=1 Tax=Flavobacterium aestivum TaxID=3003257 RepID=UPI002482A7EB|nr:metalloregulator ArsR/SmtB family transcription factor [Flavobacterium aestivum]
MGTTKKKEFKDDVNDLAILFKALGHPARMQIMNTLLIKDNCTCGEIVSALPLAQSTVSKHLLELKKANLLQVTNSGKKTIYSIELDQLRGMKHFLKSYISDVDKKRAQIKPQIAFLNEVASNPNRRTRKSNLKKFNYLFPAKKKNKNPD